MINHMWLVCVACCLFFTYLCLSLTGAGGAATSERMEKL